MGEMFKAIATRIMSLTLAMSLLTLPLALVGCNTIDGAGKDLSQSSEKVETQMDKGWDEATEGK